jgi:hypothetical protein
MTTVTSSPSGIPLPVVKLNRWILLLGIVNAWLLREPLVTTALFLLLLPAVVFGRKASLIFIVGARLFREKNLTAPTEDAGLMRFNNSIALILLGGAQIAFLFGVPLLGWILSAFVAIAAAVALGGFCFGCFLYYQYNLQRFRLFGPATRKCNT